MDTASLHTLPRDERMRLMSFVCSLAWADLRITDEERAVARSLIRRLDLEPRERQEVARLLELPPQAHCVDPTRIPRQHRELFRRVLQRTVEADGSITDEERAAMKIFDRLIAG